jgi:hypothetical protein
MQIAVTGGLGRLGRYVVRELAQHAVRVLDIGAAAECHPADLRDIGALRAGLHDIEVVVHLGGIDRSFITDDALTMQVINQSISRVIFSLTWRISRDSRSTCKKTMRVNSITQPWRHYGCARCEACKTAKAPRMSRAHCGLVRVRCIDGWRSTVVVAGMH